MCWWNGFKKFKLSDFKGKYVVILFWPWNFSPVCTTEIVQYGSRVNEFRAINCEIVGVSTDSHFTHREWTKKPRKLGGVGTMDMPLVADLTQEIA
jgi:alkyl hydroperoxide reductase subunit AhpC